jgi:hypothetical protein
MKNILVSLPAIEENNYDRIILKNVALAGHNGGYSHFVKAWVDAE